MSRPRRSQIWSQRRRSLRFPKRRKPWTPGMPRTLWTPQVPPICLILSPRPIRPRKYLAHLLRRPTSQPGGRRVHQQPGQPVARPANRVLRGRPVLRNRRPDRHAKAHRRASSPRRSPRRSRVAVARAAQRTASPPRNQASPAPANHPKCLRIPIDLRRRRRWETLAYVRPRSAFIERTDSPSVAMRLTRAACSGRLHDNSVVM